MKTKMVVVLSLLVVFSLSAETPWTKEISKEGIDVYTRKIEGSSTKEFKGRGVVNAPMEKVNTALDNIPNLVNWMPDCIESRVVEKIADNHLIIYQIIKLPRPTSNRDFAFETVITIKSDTIVRTVKAVPHQAVPVNRGLVRITDMAGEWVLTRYGANKEQTFVEYRISSDPAGNIPAWLANRSSIELPYKTIIGLRDQVQ